MKITVIALMFAGWQVTNWGGNLNNEANAGLWYANFNNSSGNTNANIGAQLSLKDTYPDVITLPLGKKHKFQNSTGNASERSVNLKQMKRENNLYESICSLGNIEQAFHNAKKGKRHYSEVKEIEKNPQKYFQKLQNILQSCSFKNSEYHIFTKQCSGKTREIYKLPFYPDRIVHHCIVQVLAPIWLKVFVRNTFSTIPKRGIHDGVNRIRESLKDVKNTTYCLKMDIKKYYPSIDHSILKDLLERKIKDKKVMFLLSEIIDSAPGIPIGNYLSQWLGNYYLAFFDHYVKEQLQVKYYFRYCDDLVYLHSDKNLLWQIKSECGKYLSEHLNLQLKGNYQVFPIDIHGIDFLGYRFYHTHTLVRKTIVAEFKRKVKNEKTTPQIQSAYWGWFKHANTFNLTSKYFEHERIQSKAS